MCRTVLTLKVGDRLEAKDYLRIPYSEFMMDKKNTLAICHGIVKACCIMLGEDWFFFYVSHCAEGSWEDRGH